MREHLSFDLGIGKDDEGGKGNDEDDSRRDSDDKAIEELCRHFRGRRAVAANNLT